MEQGSDFARAGVDPGEIGPLMAVAPMACPREIVEGSLAPMLAGDDMFEMEGLEGRESIGEVAVLAPPACTLTDLLAQRVAHLTRARPAFGARLSGATWQ